MNYPAIYARLVKRAKLRMLVKGAGVERHHIVPRCMGGSDEPENLVYLTAEEHFICHQLLIKIHPSKTGLIYAIIRMMGKDGKAIKTGKTYAWIRQLVAMRGDKNPARRNDVRTLISKALRADRSTPFLCVETGTIFQTYAEATDWFKSLGFDKITRASICKAVNGKSGKRYGYRFERITE